MSDPLVTELIERAEYLDSDGWPESAKACLRAADALDAAALREQALREALEQKVAEWRESAQEEATERGPSWVGAESKLRSCADELDELLTGKDTTQ